MFDIEKFLDEFDGKSNFDVIKGLAMRLSSATSDLDRMAILNFLFYAADYAETEYNIVNEKSKKYWNNYIDERKKNIELKKKIESIQKAAST